jgi:hypothetical protein
MTGGHDGPGSGPHDRAMNPVSQALDPEAAPILTCGGGIHVERGQPLLLDPMARNGRSRVALVEDGAVFCGSCADELGRGGDSDP